MIFNFCLFSFVKNTNKSFTFLRANIKNNANHTANIINPRRKALPKICISLNAINGEYTQKSTHKSIRKNTASPIKKGLEIKNFPIFFKILIIFFQPPD